MLHLFLFYRYGVLRDLYSFPTRRSSDLLPHGRYESLDAPYGHDSFLVAETAVTKITNQFLNATEYEHEHNYRSEEHTSELQSRLHLVCRLLLEKKNNDETTK